MPTTTVMLLGQLHFSRVECRDLLPIEGMDTPATERTIRGLAKVAKVYLTLGFDFIILGKE